MLSQQLGSSLLPSSIASSSYRFDHWRTDDGLPDNTINALLQTSDGYLWLGTQRGLARFDGIRFTTFNTSNTPALRNNAISSLCEDRTKTLWIGTGGGGVTRLDSAGFSTITTTEGLLSNYVASICEDPSGAIWVGTAGGGVTRFLAGTLAHLTKKTGLPSDFVKHLVVDRNGVLWIGSNGGGLTGFFNGSMEHFTTRDGLPSNDVETICEDRDGTLLIGTVSGIVRLRNGRIARDGALTRVPSPFTTALLVDNEGVVWIGTSGGGLCRYVDNTLQTYSVIDGLNKNFVTALRQDREGNVWIGTERGGLNMLQKTKLVTLTTRNGLGSDFVRSVYQGRDGVVWAGTNGGGLSFLKEGNFTTIPLRETLSNEIVRPLLQDRSGKLWIGTWGGGVGVYENGRVTRPGLLRNFPGRHIRAIVEDRLGGIWIGTNGEGAHKFANGHRTIYDSKHGLSNDFVSCIAEDSSGTIWIGTSGGGLNRLRDDSVTTFRSRGGITSDFVTALHVDADETLWIGTNGGGLCRFRRGRTDSWSTAAGLVDDVIFAIVDDKEGNFWLSGPRGISRVSKQQLEAFSNGTLPQLSVVSFDETDGMRSSECSSGSQNAGCRTNDGRIWIPTVDGLVVVDPRSIRKDSLRFPLYIEQLLIDKKPAKFTPLITAEYGNGDIEVRYTALSFNHARKLQFQYRLEGFEASWQVAGNRRTAFYTNVPPGDYVFHVEAEPDDGSSLTQRASLRFTIKPPFWMTGWFRVLLGLCAAGLVAGTVRFFSTQKLKRKLKTAESQTTLERERVRISKDMHDELGASLTKITLLGELAKRDVSNPGKMEQHLDLIANASRDVAGTMDEIVWAVNPRNDTVDNLAAYLIDYTTEYLSVSTLQLQTDVPEDLPARHVSAEIRHNVFLVFKEALTNIAKHAQARHVNIAFRFEDPVMTITLKDDGRGFTGASADRFSNGLDNMRKRIEEIGGSFAIESELQRGTSVNVNVRV